MDINKSANIILKSISMKKFQTVFEIQTLGGWSAKEVKIEILYDINTNRLVFRQYLFNFFYKGIKHKTFSWQANSDWLDFEWDNLSKCLKNSCPPSPVSQFDSEDCRVNEHLTVSNARLEVIIHDDFMTAQDAISFSNQSSISTEEPTCLFPKMKRAALQYFHLLF